MSDDEAVKRSFPNVANTTLMQALAESSYLDCVGLTVGDVYDRNPECRSCAYRTRCVGGCRARGIDEGGMGNYLGIDRSACWFNRGGFYDRAAQMVDELCQPSAATKQSPLSTDGA